MMMRVFVLGVSLLVTLLWACSEEEELPAAGARPGTSQNGTLCQSPHTCKGSVCLAFDDRTTEGYCSEPCEGTCHYGGDCLKSSEFEDGRCLMPCSTRSDCEGEAYCQPLNDAQVCTSKFDCEATGETYCVRI